jgi:hypothetical protein
LEGSFGLNREPDSHFGGPVENFKQMSAQQALELALGPVTAGQCKAAVSGVTFWADDIGFFHPANMRRKSVNFQSEGPTLKITFEGTFNIELTSGRLSA